MARIMVNQPVLRKEPDFILQSILGHMGVGGTAAGLATLWVLDWGGQVVRQGDPTGLFRSQQYLFFPVSFWKTSSQYVIFSSVRV